MNFTIGSDDTFTFHMDGKTRSVRTDHPSYKKILEALQENDWDTILKLSDPAKAVEMASNGEFRVVDGQVFTNDFDGNEFEVPLGLNEEILKYLKLNLDYKRLILFARRLMGNPSYRAITMLFEWIQKAGLTITEEGKFIAYRGVMVVTDKDRSRPSFPDKLKTATYIDWHSRSFDNSLGQIVSMPRNKVDENPSHSCSPGLHAATYDYAHRFSNGNGGVVTFVEICPSDVVAVPDGEPYKMRVCKYTVIGLSEAPMDSPHYDEEVDEVPDTEPNTGFPETEDVQFTKHSTLQVPNDDDDEDEELCDMCGCHFDEYSYCACY